MATANSSPPTASASSSSAATAAAASSSSSSQKHSSFEFLLAFECRPKDLFDVLTDSRFVSSYTQSQAKFSAEKGGAFSYFEGGITGVNDEFVANERMVQRWRMKEWVEDEYSTVKIVLTAIGPTTTKLSLSHSHIPEADRYGNRDIAEKVQSGWKRYWFDRIEKMIGYRKVDLKNDDDDD